MTTGGANVPAPTGIAWSGVEWRCAAAFHRDFVAVSPSAAHGSSGALPTIARDPTRVRSIPRCEFSCSDPTGRPLSPAAGRFYPPRCLPGARIANPFRVVNIEAQSLTVDTNDPWAGFDRRRVFETWPGASLPVAATGSRDILGRLARVGAALQACHQIEAGDHPGAVGRIDESSDRRFYDAPRRVHHVDAHARTVLVEIHRRQFADIATPAEGAVLDLMSGFATYLPAGLGRPVIGLGLNAEELGANPALSAGIVADLNDHPILPFADRSIAAATCAMSVEYLTDPIAVFLEVGRVLAPGGVFVVSWSERWFPTKAVAIWAELHPYERAARVVRHLAACDAFTSIVTESRRGLARPADDRYAGRLAESDPIYAVAARRR